MHEARRRAGGVRGSIRPGTPRPAPRPADAVSPLPPRHQAPGHPLGGWRTTALLALLVLGTVGCGRKGPPLPPLVRVPAAVTDITARRLGDEVYVTFRVPAQNVDGSSPVFVDRVELRALTAPELPARPLFLERSTVIATIRVAAPDESSGEVDPAGSTPAQATAAMPPGATVTIRDELPPPSATPSPAPLPAPAAEGGAPAAVEHRYYLAVPVSGGRVSASGTAVALPLTAPPPPPGPVTIAVRPRTDAHAADLDLTWSAVEGAGGYQVYLVDPQTASRPPRDGQGADAPAPLNATPLETPAFTERVPYEQPRCYEVRAVRREPQDVLVEGPPSAFRCETPVDTVPPSPPGELAALSGDGEITLVWTPSPEPDVVGYVILRGTPGDDTLAGITATPVTGTRYVDRTVTPGVRYEYAVVAVDSRAPEGNRSAPSLRDEATAR